MHLLRRYKEQHRDQGRDALTGVARRAKMSLRNLQYYLEAEELPRNPEQLARILVAYDVPMAERWALMRAGYPDLLIALGFPVGATPDETPVKPDPNQLLIFEGAKRME